ncbi:MAG: sulfotransferase [Reichenbachiella sp.]|uniref:sulfotransferase family protein n=1 Tax=Reichenbachiella sp. TaxID=2184521 RepID=UPI0032968CE3
MKKVPNFLIAGLPKCGTTSMHHYLKHHPQIFLPSQKELHYFTHDILSKNVQGPRDAAVNKYHAANWDQYAQFYSFVDKEIAIGDVSPSYASYPECFPIIKEKLGQVKVIVLLRDPINRAYSNYLHLVREKREKLSFEQAMSEEENRQKQGYSDFWRYAYNSTYSDKVQAIKDSFDEVLVIPFELFVADKYNQLTRIFKFLGIQSDFIPPNIEERFNEGGTYQDNAITSFLHGHSPVKDFIKKVIPVDYSSFKAKILSKFRKANPQLQDDTIRKLIPFFKSDVLRLKKELGVDISLWRDYNG